MTGSVAARRVLVVHRYYAPDTAPYASMLESMVLYWHQLGFEVDVLSAQPSYKAAVSRGRLPSRQKLDHGLVRRLNLPNEAGRPLVRLLNAFKLCVALFWQALIRNRYDAIMISTSPPVVGGFFALLVAKLSRAKFVYHCMDIHPEIGRISGEFGNPCVYKALRFLDAFTCSRADAVVVLSEDMKRAIQSRRNGKQCRVAVINNFGLPSAEAPSASGIEIDPDRFTILFAGNIGRFQGLEVLVKAMVKLKGEEVIEAVLMGEGVMREALEAEAKQSGANVRFVGHHPVATAKSAMQASTIGYVSLVAGIYKYAYPSKTTTYLEQGCPLLVSIEPESDLAKQVLDDDLGAVVEPGSVNALASKISELAASPDKVKLFKRQAEKIGPQQFRAKTVLPAWGTLLTGLFE